MSYEGSIQRLCKNNHYSIIDCYDEYDEEVCHCGEPFIWRNGVDLTNGSFCSEWDEVNNRCLDTYCDEKQHKYCQEHHGRIDGYVDLEMLEEAVYKECKCCGSKKLVKEARYKVPEV